MCLWHEGSCSQRGDTRGEVREEFSLLRASGAAGEAVKPKECKERQPQEAEGSSEEPFGLPRCSGLAPGIVSP